MFKMLAMHETVNLLRKAVNTMFPARYNCLWAHSLPVQLPGRMQWTSSPFRWVDSNCRHSFNQITEKFPLERLDGTPQWQFARTHYVNQQPSLHHSWMARCSASFRPFNKRTKHARREWGKIAHAVDVQKHQNNEQWQDKTRTGIIVR